MYAELVCRSNYSFLKGASHPEELVRRAAELGLSALALCDDDGLYGAVKAHLEAKELGLKLLIDDAHLARAERARRGALRGERHRLLELELAHLGEPPRAPQG
jgi:DNA polymerase III alpha subunit